MTKDSAITQRTIWHRLFHRRPLFPLYSELDVVMMLPFANAIKVIVFYVDLRGDGA